jgi:hypothetical protein
MTTIKRCEGNTTYLGNKQLYVIALLAKHFSSSDAVSIPAECRDKTSQVHQEIMFYGPSTQIGIIYGTILLFCKHLKQTVLIIMILHER